MDLVQGKLSVTNGLIGNANAFLIGTPLPCRAWHALFSPWWTHTRRPHALPCQGTGARR